MKPDTEVLTISKEDFNPTLVLWILTARGQNLPAEIEDLWRRFKEDEGRMNGTS